MNRETILRVVLSGCVAVWVMACAGVGDRWVAPALHPEEEGENLRYCLDCHDAADENMPYRRYVHTPMFMENHRSVAAQRVEVCFMCHASAYCNDCHGVWVELKPSLKNQTDPQRRMPHRGDYITRHRIDGRTNPTACRRCHGNPKTAQTCRPCHG